MRKQSPMSRRHETSRMHLVGPWQSNCILGGRYANATGILRASMSEENVEFLEGLFAGAADLDKRALLDALPELIAQTCDPEIEWVEDPQRADGRVYRGHEGVRQSWERWLENFEDYDAELERMVDCGDKVLVVATEQGRGALSGATVSQRMYSVFSFRDGKIARYEEFLDERAARDAAGLSP